MEEDDRPLPPTLEGPRVLLRMARAADAPRIVAYYRENFEHLRRSMPKPSPMFFLEENWREQARNIHAEWHSGRTARFFVFLKGKDDVVGTVNLTMIQRAPAHTCNLGYGLARSLEGKGYMTEAVRLGIDFAWKTLNLHRVAANYRPANERSGKLLRKLGFVVEGYARDYLFLDGEWCDHVLTSKTNPDWVAP